MMIWNRMSLVAVAAVELVVSAAIAGVVAIEY